MSNPLQIKNLKNNIYQWKNINNKQFYDFIPEDLLPGFSLKGGLNTGCDLDLILKDIQRAETILEVGAGYGRVIENLLAKGYQKKLTAIERSQRFCNILRSKFKQKVEIIQADIREVVLSDKYDVILWLWSGICDFAQDEQLPVLTKVAGFLNARGLLAIDSLLSTTMPVNANAAIEQYAVIPGGENCNLYVYTPSQEEMKGYADALNLKLEIIPYKTTTDRQRMFYLFSSLKN